MTKQISKLAEQVFKELSDQILCTHEQKQQKMIDDLFGNISSKSLTYSARIIDEDEENSERFPNKKQIQSDHDITEESQQNTAGQDSTRSMTSSSCSDKTKNITHIQLRNLASSKFKNSCIQIEESPFNYSHEDIQTKAKNLLLNFFCHYCQIFEEIQLKPEAQRMQKEVLKLFLTNSIKIFCSLFRKGFRRMVTLTKCLFKLMFVSGLIPKKILSIISKEIKILIGVRVEELLIEHQKMAYESAFRLNNMTMPVDFDIVKIKKQQKEEKLMAKKKLKQQLKKYSPTEIKSLHQSKLLTSIKTQAKLELKEKKKSHFHETLLTQISNPAAKIESSLTFKNPIQQIDFHKMKSENTKIKKESSPSLQKKPSHQLPTKTTKQKASYRVIQTIILDEENHFEQRKIGTHPNIELQTKIKQLQKPQVEPSSPIVKIQTQNPTQILQSPLNLPTKSMTLQDITKKLSSSDIEEIKRKLKESYTLKLNKNCQPKN